jgi:hypothetical protein
MKLILITSPMELNEYQILLKIADGTQFKTHKARLWVYKEKALPTSRMYSYTLARESNGERDKHLPIENIPRSEVLTLQEFMDECEKRGKKKLTKKRSIL